MASNASKYYASYMQSHTERFQKFRDEAYQELVMLGKNDLAYKKILQQREKAMLDALGRLKASKPTGDAKIDYDALSLILRANGQIIDASEDAAKRGIEIEKSLRSALTPSKASNDKIAEMEATLATAGAVSGDPAVVEAAINSGIDGIAGTVAPGSTQAAAAAQNAYKSLSGQAAFNSLSPAQKEALRGRLTTTFGLDSVNIAGASGITLLDVPQDVLVDRELDRQLQEYGGAFGVKKAQDVIKKIEDAQRAAVSGDAAAASKAIEDAKIALIGKIEGELPGVQKKLEAVPEIDLSEATVRKLARQKYAPEAATFLKKQFERDLLGDDPDKLLHYDAIEAAKEGKIKLDAKAVTAAQQFIGAYVPLDVSKAERRKAAIDAAVEYAGGDKKKRDEFLVAFHKIQMEGTDERTGPSDILPEPVPPFIEPEKLGDADKLPGPGRLKGGGREERLAEVEKDIGVRQAITDKMVDLVRQKDALDKIGIANFTPEQEQKYDDLIAGMATLRTEYNKPQYDPEIFAAERADLRRALYPKYSKPLNEMLEAERLGLAQEQEPFPSGYDVPPRRVRTSVGNLPSMSDLFTNELEALLPRQKQIQR